MIFLNMVCLKCYLKAACKKQLQPRAQKDPTIDFRLIRKIDSLLKHFLKGFFCVVFIRQCHHMMSSYDNIIVRYLGTRNQWGGGLGTRGTRDLLGGLGTWGLRTGSYSGHGNSGPGTRDQGGLGTTEIHWIFNGKILQYMIILSGRITTTSD